MKVLILLILDVVSLRNYFEHHLRAWNVEVCVLNPREEREINDSVGALRSARTLLHFGLDLLHDLFWGLEERLQEASLNVLVSFHEQLVLLVIRILLLTLLTGLGQGHSFRILLQIIINALFLEEGFVLLCFVGEFFLGVLGTVDLVHFFDVAAHLAEDLSIQFVLVEERVVSKGDFVLQLADGDLVEPFHFFS